MIEMSRHDREFTPGGGCPEYSPREIAARGVDKVMTEKIISQVESLRIRTGCSVVRSARSTGSGP